MVQEIDTTAGQGDPTYPAGMPVGMSYEQQIMILGEAARAWADDWQKQGGHEARLTVAYKGVLVLAELVKELYIQANDRENDEEDFKAEWEAASDKLFPKPKPVAEELQASVETLEAKIFGEGGFKDIIAGLIKDSDEKMDTMLELVAEMSEKVETQGVKLKKHESKKPDPPPAKLPEDKELDGKTKKKRAEDEETAKKIEVHTKSKSE